MIRPTLKKLNELLTDEDLPQPVTKAHCETYGPKTMAYFRCRNMVQRRRVEAMLTAAGCRVNPTYWTVRGGAAEDVPCVEVQVSYLRAYGWQQ